ncbi:MAG: FAD-dependent oxidoreductase [Mycobacterium sp.]
MPDVVVLGAGLAGLTAALRARETDRSVVIVDPEPDGNGANSRISGGVFHLAWGALDEPADDLVRRMVEQTDGEVDPQLARALADASGSAIRWLAEQGVELGPKGSRPHDKFTCQPWLEARGVTPAPERGAESALRILRERARQAGVRFVRGSADALRRDADEWQVGVGGSEAVVGRSVIVATGGFQADPQMMRAFVGPHADDVFLRSTRSSTGDGLRLLIGAGAAVTEPSSAVYGHLLSASAVTETRLWPQPTVDAVARRGLLVDRDGHAFTPDVDNGIALVNAMVRTGDPSGFTVVFDGRTRDEASAERGATQTDGHLRDVAELTERGAEIFEANSISDLTVRLRIPRAQLKKSVDAWTEGKSSGPWFAMRVLPGVTATMRGVRIDGRCRVLGRDGAPLEGLSAAGDVAGVHGGPRGGYLGGLAVALISGFISGAA